MLRAGNPSRIQINPSSQSQKKFWEIYFFARAFKKLPESDFPDQGVIFAGCVRVIGRTIIVPIWKRGDFRL